MKNHAVSGAATLHSIYDRSMNPELVRDLKLRIEIKELADIAQERGYQRLSHLLYTAVIAVDEMIRGKEDGDDLRSSSRAEQPAVR